MTLRPAVAVPVNEMSKGLSLASLLTMWMAALRAPAALGVKVTVKVVLVLSSSTEGMMRAIEPENEGSEQGYCNACYTGHYPMPVDEAQPKLSFEGALS